MSANLDSSTPAPVSPTYKKLRIIAALIREPLWVIFCMFGLSVVFVFGLMKLFPELEAASETTVGQLIASAVIYGLAVLFVLVPFLLTEERRRHIARLLGIHKPLRWTGIAWAFSAFAIYFWATILVGILVMQIPGFDSEQPQDVGFADVTTVIEYLMAFVGLVVLPPIFEEILFRGYLFGRLRQYVGFWVTALVTSAAFGLVHGQWNVGVDTFVLSFFLCFLREHTGNIWASVVLHAIKNGLAYFFLFLAPLWGINLI